MLKEALNGVCMAIADSVPGVSGGTIAFIMDFYDKFIGSINNIVFGNKEKRFLKISCKIRNRVDIRYDARFFLCYYNGIYYFRCTTSCY